MTEQEPQLPEPQDQASDFLPDDGAPQAAEESATGDAPVDSEVLALQAELVAAQSEAAERLNDLQRLQAEYVNYRKRVDRDRELARTNTLVDVAENLIAVFDEIELARQHGELDGTPFASIAEKLEATLGRYGWERYGATGEEFDPAVHEALISTPSAEVEVTTVAQVLQPGYRVGERVVRAARVAVSSPE